MISIGSSAKVNRDIQSANGMMYKGTKIRVRQHKDGYTQVSDGAGRLFWVKSHDISV